MINGIQWKMSNDSIDPQSIENHHSILSSVMLWGLFGLSIPGFLLNLIVCAISFHPDVKGDYKWFIFHLSIVDMIYSISNTVHASFMLFPGTYDGIFCQISAIVHWNCILLSLVALLPLIFHRLCSLRFQNIADHISTKTGIGITIAICDLFVLFMVIPYPMIFSRIVRNPKGYSCDFEPAKSLGGIIYGAFILSETPILFGILVYLSVHIIWILHKRKNDHVGERSKVMRLKETRALMRATIIQATIPMLVQLPLLITTAIYVVGGSVNADWDTFTAFIHSVNPIADAVVTFIVVRSYQRALCMRLGIVSPCEIPSGMLALERMSKMTRINSTISMVDLRHFDIDYSLAQTALNSRRMPSIAWES